VTDQINQLTTVTEVDNSTLWPVWSSSQSMKATGPLILAWLQANLTFTGLALAQQYAAPSATGFSVTLEAADSWLILTPLAGYAAGTIVLPSVRTNGQVVQVNCTQAVTTLTVSGNGTTVTGAPTTLAANGFFKLQFDAVLAAWFRVG
jgi:hypothetical protein